MHRNIKIRAADASYPFYAARARLQGLVQYFLSFLVPSFVWPLFLNDNGIGAAIKRRKRQNTTAYLDGLRGVAALVVYVFHITYAWFPVLKNGYGVTPRDHFFLQWPFVRTIVSGRGGVVVFFVLSGYVLSIKAITLASRGQYGEAFESLAQSMFRRVFRLYVPIVASTFLTALIVRFDTFPVHPLNTNLPPRLGTLSGQLSDWALATITLMNPFRLIPGRDNLYSPPYNGHLWTIPMEMKGSLLIFGFLLALVRTKRWVRVCVTATLMYLQLKQGDLDMALFLSGMLLAEYSVKMLSDKRLSDKRVRFRSGPAGCVLFLCRSLICTVIFMVGLYMLGYPEENDVYSRGYVWMSAHVPAPYSGSVYSRQFFWHAVGGVIFVGSLVWAPPRPHVSFFQPWQRPGEFCGEGRGRDTAEVLYSLVGAEVEEPYLQRPFTTRFAQYLGQASYSLYLLHGPVIQTVAIRYLIPAVDSYEQDATESQSARTSGRPDAANTLMIAATNEYLGQFITSAIVSTVVVFYISDAFMRAVDMHASSIGRKVMRFCWAKVPEVSPDTAPLRECIDREQSILAF